MAIVRKRNEDASLKTMLPGTNPPAAMPQVADGASRMQDGMPDPRGGALRIEEAIFRTEDRIFNLEDGMTRMASLSNWVTSAMPRIASGMVQLHC